MMFTYFKLFFIIFLLSKCQILCYYTNVKTIDWPDVLALSEVILAQQAGSAATATKSASPSSLSLASVSRGQFGGSDIDYYPTWSYLYLKPQRNIDEELKRLKAEPPRGLPNVMRYG
ncbi:hypothetical protein MN116_007095 [Schistosoma mekongi]|uniref:Uncharacterized protein n=1 Tax=Schistosoma mekongi TaxID=38744 RepID=A0AAE2D3A6_SCHME|nr:hypothetical protein MN116_007095 [Schistosoma mekongi]